LSISNLSNYFLDLLGVGCIIIILIIVIHSQSILHALALVLFLARYVWEYVFYELVCWLEYTIVLGVVITCWTVFRWLVLPGVPVKSLLHEWCICSTCITVVIGGLMSFIIPWLNPFGNINCISKLLILILSFSGFKILLRLIRIWPYWIIPIISVCFLYLFKILSRNRVKIVKELTTSNVKRCVWISLLLRHEAIHCCLIHPS
jgi:hypothetical protein